MVKIKEDQPYNRVNDVSMKDVIIRNFVGGIFWALGITIGFSLLIALLSLISRSVDVIPIIGTFVSDVIDFVLSYNKSLRRP